MEELILKKIKLYNSILYDKSCCFICGRNIVTEYMEYIEFNQNLKLEDIDLNLALKIEIYVCCSMIFKNCK